MEARDGVASPSATKARRVDGGADAGTASRRMRGRINGGVGRRRRVDGRASGQLYMRRKGIFFLDERRRGEGEDSDSPTEVTPLPTHQANLEK